MSSDVPEDPTDPGELPEEPSDPDERREPWVPPPGVDPARRSPRMGTKPILGRTDRLIEAIKAMTLIELSEFVKEFKETFDPSAVAPTEIEPAAGNPESDGAASDGDVTLLIVAAGDKEILVIRAVRAITGLGPKEAKELVEATSSGPQTVLRSVSASKAQRAVGALESAGAIVALE